MKEVIILFFTYDLQNVFSLLKVYVEGYKSKLNTYNLTAHSSTNNCFYSTIWHEYTCWRGGTHITNAIIKILKVLLKDNPNLSKIIIWSDS